METKKNEYVRFDWAMKRLLRDKANFSVLEGLLSAILNSDVKILKILESNSNRINKRDKSNTVDVKAEMANHEIVIIEVQNLFQMDFLKRSIFGASRAVTEQLSIGDQYRKIKKVYSISIVYFDMGVGDDYLYVGRTKLVGAHTGTELKISEDEREAYESDNASDAFPEYWLLRVNEFDKHAKTPLEEWMQYLKTGHIEDNTKDTGLIRAKEVLSYDAMSQSEKRAYESYLNQRVCERDSIQKARRDGKVEVAENMKNLGVSTDLIAKYTGLTPEEIEKL